MPLLSKQTLQKSWKEDFWSPKGYNSFCGLRIQLYWAWFVFSDLLCFKVFFFCVTFASIAKKVIILLDKLEALGQESDHLDETGLRCVNLGTELC